MNSNIPLAVKHETENDLRVTVLVFGQLGKIHFG
jgi:hypothetical protein